jgi:signal transduction histidine kinase
VPCDVFVQEDFDDLDPDWSIALYRIAQESLTNVTRHAKASSVRLHLDREADGVRLRIIDDGVGMPADSPSRSVSHGLIGMRERIRQVGGVICIGSRPEPSGTVVDAFIPYPRDCRSMASAVGN